MLHKLGLPLCVSPGGGRCTLLLVSCPRQHPKVFDVGDIPRLSFLGAGTYPNLSIFCSSSFFFRISLRCIWTDWLHFWADHCGIFGPLASQPVGKTIAGFDGVLLRWYEVFFRFTTSPLLTRLASLLVR